MSRFHHFKQEPLNPPLRRAFRLYWLNGDEWRGVLLVVGLHEFGFRLGKDNK